MSLSWSSLRGIGNLENVLPNEDKTREINPGFHSKRGEETVIQNQASKY